MSEEDIDLERVIVDPAYRRRVINRLNEDDGRDPRLVALKSV